MPSYRKVHKSTVFGARHSPHDRTFPTIAARNAYTYLPEDIDKFYRVDVPRSIWWLAALVDGVPTFEQMNGGGSVDAGSIISGTIDPARLPASVMERMYTYTGAQTAPESMGLTTTNVQNGDWVKINNIANAANGSTWIVINDTLLHLAGGYEPISAGAAASVPWTGVTSKPQPVLDLLGVNTGDETLTTLVSTLDGAATKNTLANSDSFFYRDGIAGIFKKISVSNFITALRTILDTVYAPYGSGGGSFSGNIDQHTFRTFTASHTLVKADGNTSVNNWPIIEMNVVSANTLTVPADTGDNLVDFSVGTEICIQQIGVGVTTIAPEGSTVTITGASGLIFAARYQFVYLIKTAANTWTATGSLSNVPPTNIGKQSLFIASPSMGDGVVTATFNTTTNTYQFDGTTAQDIYCNLALPKSWDAGTITFKAIFTQIDAGTGTIRFTLQGATMSSGDTLVTNNSTGTAQGSATAVGATGTVFYSAESAAITMAGTPTKEDLIHFVVKRDVADTYTGIASLIGIIVYYNTDAANDA